LLVDIILLPTLLDITTSHCQLDIMYVPMLSNLVDIISHCRSAHSSVPAASVMCRAASDRYGGNNVEMDVKISIAGLRN